MKLLSVKVLLAAVTLLLVSSFHQARAGLVVAHWTFETSSPATAGPHFAELGSQAGVARATGFHTDASTTYSSPAGNGSAKSFNSNRWTTIGDYYQFQVNLTGLSNASFQWDQTRSATGPGDFNLQWSIDGDNFTTILNYSVAEVTWSSGSYSSASTFSPVVLPTAVNNQMEVYIRLRSNAIASNSAGTSRVDNVIVTAAIPEPGSLTLCTLAGLTGLVIRRRSTR
jgi:hypothetical protein